MVEKVTCMAYDPDGNKIAEETGRNNNNSSTAVAKNSALMKIGGKTDIDEWSDGLEVECKRG